MDYCLVQVSNCTDNVTVIRAAVVGTPLQPVINDSDTDKDDVIVQDLSASWSMDSNKLTLNSISFSVNKVRSYAACLP